MMARRLPGILPPLTLAESIEITKIHSVAGLVPEGARWSRSVRSGHPITLRATRGSLVAERFPDLAR